jgi:hypothetical protein
MAMAFNVNPMDGLLTSWQEEWICPADDSGLAFDQTIHATDTTELTMEDVVDLNDLEDYD